MENTNRKNRGILITIGITALVMLFVVMLLHVDKTIYPSSNMMEGINCRMSEGDYIFEVRYESDTDTELEWYYSANGKEYTLFNMKLPMTEGIDTIKCSYEMPFSLLNNSLACRLTDDKGNGCSIESIRITSSNFNYNAILTLLLYLIVASILTVVMKISDRGVVLLSVLSLVLEPLFLVNIVLVVLWCALAVIAAVLIKREMIKVTEDVTLFVAFLLFAVCALAFCSASSPLFPVNTGDDPNIYYSVGAALGNGKMLYSEVFDHKGPVFFFFYMLGYLLTPNYFYGIWLFEVIALAVDMYLVYRIAMHYSSRFWGVVSAFIMPVFLLNDDYLISGSTMEAFSVLFLLHMFYMILPYIDSDEVGKQLCINSDNSDGDEEANSEINDFNRFLWLGIGSSVIFWSKFSISVTWIYVSVVVIISCIRKSVLKKIAGYAAGWVITTVPVILYFVFNGGIVKLYRYYYIFNRAYGAIDSLDATLARIIGNVYSAFIDNKAVTTVIIIGIVYIITFVKKINNLGKVIIAGSFIVLCGTAYAGSNSYAYYFTLIAVYSLWAVVGLGDLLSKLCLLIGKTQDEDGSRMNTGLNSQVITAMALLSFGIVLLNNNMIEKSILIDREPRFQQIIAQQMIYNSDDGDTSFFELGFLDKGFYPVSKQYPPVQFFFYPNIGYEQEPEPYEEQFSYLENGVTKYFIWRGFNESDEPGLDVALNNYSLVVTVNGQDGKYYSLYKKTNI